MTADGLALARRFFLECVEPLVAEHAPDLAYAAALVGDGSEVLGFDTALSTDHDWGPRLQIFLDERDFDAAASALIGRLDKGLPETFDGWPVRYADADRAADDPGARGSVHGVELYTVAGWARRHLAWDGGEDLTPAGWLGLPEQSLLEATAGEVFRDDAGALTAFRERLAYFPDDVWLHKLACQWRRIAEEQAFVGRAGEAGDDMGSRVIAARLARDVMGLVFLIERRYAPYSKWLGSAFGRLPGAADLRAPLERALSAETWPDREAALAESYRLAAELQRARDVPGAVTPRIGPYFGRPFIVVNADEIAAGLRAQIGDAGLRDLALTGSVDQISDNAVILANPQRSRRLMAGALGGEG